MASAPVILANRSVQQLVFVTFLVIGLIKSTVAEVRVPLAYRSSALSFDGHSEVVTKKPALARITVKSAASFLFFHFNFNYIGLVDLGTISLVFLIGH